MNMETFEYHWVVKIEDWPQKLLGLENLIRSNERFPTKAIWEVHEGGRAAAVTRIEIIHRIYRLQLWPNVQIEGSRIHELKGRMEKQP